MAGEDEPKGTAATGARHDVVANAYDLKPRMSSKLLLHKRGEPSLAPARRWLRYQALGCLKQVRAGAT
jgi:hypothetical protein